MDGGFVASNNSPSSEIHTGKPSPVLIAQLRPLRNITPIKHIHHYEVFVREGILTHWISLDCGWNNT